MRPDSDNRANNLIWLDMEMTGLQPDSDRIIEVALLVTDSQLNILAESPVWVLHQPDEVLAQHVPANASPMCGNSICQDRRFLARWMPRLEAHFHYRNLDVSTLKELVRRWKPELAKGFIKEGKHEALADILESIEELKFYRKSVMTI
jgi:oligoribonuclease